MDPHCKGSLLASALATIQADRERWGGTQRTVCTEDELEARYFIRDVLGKGSFGTVHRVIRIEDAEELAVKIIDHGISDGERASAIDECALWQVISSPYHPSILPLLEVIEVIGGDSLHLITQQMLWGNLDQALRDPDVDKSEQSARLMMIQLLSAVEHLHMVHSIAHRDIKPENVLCEMSDPTIPGCLKLCDFGCCKRFESLTDPTFDEAIGACFRHLRWRVHPHEHAHAPILTTPCCRPCRRLCAACRHCQLFVARVGDQLHLG